eukprot:CFRG4142T1
MRFGVSDQEEKKMANSKITIKAKFQDDLRRFTIPIADLSYMYLMTRLRELFNIVDFTLKLTYVDPDGDAVSVCCDKDVQEVMKVALSLKSPLRLNVVHVPEDGTNQDVGDDDDSAWILTGAISRPPSENGTLKDPQQPQSPQIQTPSLHEAHTPLAVHESTQASMGESASISSVSKAQYADYDGCEHTPVLDQCDERNSLSTAAIAEISIPIALLQLNPVAHPRFTPMQMTTCREKVYTTRPKRLSMIPVDCLDCIQT